MEKRSTIFLVGFDEVFPKILEWNLSAWMAARGDLFGEKKTDGLHDWFEPSHTLTTIIERIGERAIQERQYFFSNFFLEHFQKHVDAQTERIRPDISSKRYYVYVRDLLSILYRLLFEKASGGPESEEIWRRLPGEWKVSKENLEGDTKKLVLARTAFEQFLRWAEQRMASNQTFDRQLNDVLINLFPGVDPEAWARILIFVLSPYSENRVQSVIERSWNFGFRLDVVSFSGEEKMEEAIASAEQRKQTEIQNAYELASLIFSNVFTEELLKESVEQAKKLKYAKRSAEDRKRLELLKLFEGLQTVREK